MVPELIEKDGKVYGDKLIYGKRYNLCYSAKEAETEGYYFGNSGKYFLFFSLSYNNPLDEQKEVNPNSISLEGVNISCYKSRKDKPVLNNKKNSQEIEIPLRFLLSSSSVVKNELEKRHIFNKIRELDANLS